MTSDGRNFPTTFGEMTTVSDWVGAYQEFVHLIPRDSINTIVELGSRDLRDALWLQKYFDAEVVAWECNPEAIRLCRDTLGGYLDAPVTFVPKAAWSKNTILTFRPVVSNGFPGGNIGASSVFKANPDYPYEIYKQETIAVDAERLDEWWGRHRKYRNLDLLCMDIQGSELEALKGAGDLLDGVKFIITEGQTKRLYDDTPLIGDLITFLGKWGFRLVERKTANDWFGDYLFAKF